MPALLKNTRCLSLALLLIAPLALAKGVHYDVFLLAGQSNMDGRGKTAELTGELATYAAPLPRVVISLSTGGLNRPLVVSKGFEPLQPGFAGIIGKAATLPSPQFGPELGFGHTLAKAHPEKHLLLIKCTEGGTNLKNDWNPDQPKKLYERFIAFVRTNQKTMEANGDTYEIRGFLWHQGESDAGQPAGVYQANLTALIQRVRTDLGLPQLPVLIGQVYNNGKRDNIFADQKSVVSTVPETYLVESAGLETWDNGTHFDAKSQIELGARFARQMLKQDHRAKGTNPSS